MFSAVHVWWSKRVAAFQASSSHFRCRASLEDLRHVGMSCKTSHASLSRRQLVPCYCAAINDALRRQSPLVASTVFCALFFCFDHLCLTIRIDWNIVVFARSFESSTARVMLLLCNHRCITTSISARRIHCVQCSYFRIDDSCLTIRIDWNIVVFVIAFCSTRSKAFVLSKSCLPLWTWNASCISTNGALCYIRAVLVDTRHFRRSRIV